MTQGTSGILSEWSSKQVFVSRRIFSLLGCSCLSQALCDNNRLSNWNRQSGSLLGVSSCKPEKDKNIPTSVVANTRRPGLLAPL